MNHDIKVNGTLTLNDYKDFQNLYLSRRSYVSMRFLIYFIVFIGVFCLIAIQDNNANALPRYLLVALPIGIAIGLISTFLTRLMRNSKIKRTFSSDKLIQKEHTYYFNPEHIRSESENGSFTITWDEVYKVKKNKKIYSLFLAKNKGLIIPKRFFKDDVDIARFEELLKSKRVK